MATLAPELIREIVEFSVEGSLSHAANLAAISHDFHEWTRPILSRTLMYYDSGSETQWPVPLDKLPKWLEANGRYVRNLIWGIELNTGNLLSVLKECSGITNLAVWVDTSENDLTIILPILSTLRLSQFSIDLYELFDKHDFSKREASCVAFRAITHLDIIRPINAWKEMEGVAHLPHLTHLSIPRSDPAIRVANVALEECKSLKVLVTVADIAYTEDSPVQASQTDLPSVLWRYGDIRHEDPRLVAFDCDGVADWVNGSIGKKNMWALADEIVERRLKNRTPLADNPDGAPN
ncbi:hypothetical protein BDN72DRAFT_843682 [Pluteus cervinus]|uniref:Uncharacterized protein n=1 Tax=Pluteus cervinus TaxID=181527 RepID=A0ACD3AMF0_9AGAR|nr:hypothetical protein BDN72DRAFT_843682 [Pluteus cervinus]